MTNQIRPFSLCCVAHRLAEGQSKHVVAGQVTLLLQREETMLIITMMTLFTVRLTGQRIPSKAIFGGHVWMFSPRFN